MSVTTGTTSYTHECCSLCGSVLHCSEAEPWEPPSGFGWCHHGTGLEPAGLRRMQPGDRHECPHS